MPPKKIFLIVALLALPLNWLNLLAQELGAKDLDSLLNNKRVYQSVNIGDLDKPRINGLLDDEIWSLGVWKDDFIQDQ